MRFTFGIVPARTLWTGQRTMLLIAAVEWVMLAAEGRRVSAWITHGGVDVRS